MEQRLSRHTCGPSDATGFELPAASAGGSRQRRGLRGAAPALKPPAPRQKASLRRGASRPHRGGRDAYSAHPAPRRRTKPHDRRRAPAAPCAAGRRREQRGGRQPPRATGRTAYCRAGAAPSVFMSAGIGLPGSRGNGACQLVGGQRQFSRWLTPLSFFRTPDKEVIPAVPGRWLSPLSVPLIGRSSCCALLFRLVIGQSSPLRLDGLAILPPP